MVNYDLRIIHRMKKLHQETTVNQCIGTGDQSLIRVFTNPVYLATLENRRVFWNGFLEMMDVIVKTAKVNV